MPDSQAEAASRILAEMATKDDLRLLERQIGSRLEGLRTEIQSLKADLTWRLVAGIGFFAAVMTALDAFVD